MTSSYIPSTDAGFSAWLTNFSNLITDEPGLYGLTSGDATAIAAQQASYQNAYTAIINPLTRTPAAIAAKDAAKAAALAVVRPYAVSISLNSGVTNENKTAVGVTVRKTVPTPIPAPTAFPLIDLLAITPGQARLKIVSNETPTSKAKPFGCVGIQIFRSVGTAAATDPSQLAFNKTATKVPTTIGFSAEAKGKVCSVAARYVTRGGNGGEAKVGPWSEIVTFIVN